MDAFEALMQARALLEGVTPLKTDCGRLCGSLCCLPEEDEDEETGMLLFPGEEQLYLGQETWMELYEAELDFDEKPVQLLICDLPCPRNLRPLSCMAFPLFPYLRNGKIEVKMDIRARPLCPLAKHGEQGLSKEFVQAVQKAGECLLQSDVQRRYLALVTKHIDSYLFL